MSVPSIGTILCPELQEIIEVIKSEDLNNSFDFIDYIKSKACSPDYWRQRFLSYPKELPEISDSSLMGIYDICTDQCVQLFFNVESTEKFITKKRHDKSSYKDSYNTNIMVSKNTSEQLYKYSINPCVSMKDALIDLRYVLQNLGMRNLNMAGLPTIDIKTYNRYISSTSSTSIKMLITDTEVIGLNKFCKDIIACIETNGDYFALDIFGMLVYIQQVRSIIERKVSNKLMVTQSGTNHSSSHLLDVWQSDDLSDLEIYNYICCLVRFALRRDVVF